MREGVAKHRSQAFAHQPYAVDVFPSKPSALERSSGKGTQRGRGVRVDQVVEHALQMPLRTAAEEVLDVANRRTDLQIAGYARLFSELTQGSLRG